MNKLLSALGAAALALLAFAAPASAQSVVQLPTYIDNAAVLDLGNGPQELKVLGGNAQIFTSQSSGASATVTNSTTVNLRATPTTPPCAGCILTIPGTPPAANANVTVVSYSAASAQVVVSSALNVTLNTVLLWGAACPSTVGSTRVILAQASVGADLPLYTSARLCGGAQNSPGATVLLFPIGAH